MAKTDAVPTYDAVRTALGGPVSNDRLQKALGNARLAQTAPPSAVPAPAGAPASTANPQTIARQVAALVAHPLDAIEGYRAPAFAEIKAVVLRTLDALEQSCHQHDAVIAPYIERIGQLEAEAAARGREKPPLLRIGAKVICCLRWAAKAAPRRPYDNCDCTGSRSRSGCNRLS